MTKKIFKEKPTIADWLINKPYTVHKNYDIFYYKICVEVYEHLLKNYSGFLFEDDDDSSFQRQDLIDLSCTLVSYFEDFTNEIGIWKSIQLKNKELYGQYLPFYELDEDYDLEYINRQDLVYLIWFFMSKYVPSISYAPDSDAFVDMADEIFDIFENKIDDAHANDFYENYWKIQENDSFSEERLKIDWFAQFSYLCSIDTSGKYKMTLEQILEITDNYEDATSVLYEISLDIMLEQPTSWATYIPVEWFADLVKCSDTKKTELKNLSRKHSGKFQVLESTDYGKYLTLKQCVTHQEYLVSMETMEEGRPNPKPGFIVSASLVFWNKKWIIIGIMKGELKTNPEDIAEFQKEKIPFWMQSEENQQSTRDFFPKNNQDFLDFFGTELAIFSTEQEQKDALQELINYQKQPSLYDLKSTYLQRMRDTYANLETIKNPYKKSKEDFDDFGLFCDNKKGVLECTEVVQTIKMLEAEILDYEGISTLFEELTRDYHPEIANYFLETYPQTNIDLPFKSNIDLTSWLIVYWHFYSSEAFGLYNPDIVVWKG